MNFPRSIRWRIQAWHSLLLLGVIIGFCAATWRLQKSNAIQRANHELDFRLSTLLGVLGRNGLHHRDEPPPLGPPFSGNRAPELIGLFDAKDPSPFYYAVWRRDGPLLEQSNQAPSTVPRPEWIDSHSMVYHYRVRGTLREAYAFTPPGECILVGRSILPIEQEMREFTSRLVILGATLLIIGLAVGWWLASKAIQPIAEISSTAARIAEGKRAERIEIFEADNELGRLARVLNDAFDRLDAAVAQQARFSSDAAHELRTPVSIILAETQLALSKERSAPEYRETIEACRRAAQRMHGLIESLLDLSILDNKESPLERHSCDLAEIGRDHLEMMRPLAEERGVKFDSELNPADCVADTERISQILVNLLSNAVKFSSPGATIRLSTHRENGCAILQVSDTGPGIDTKHVPHLFERFYRADASRNRSTGGAGLGLAICKSIAEAHGGSLTVESELGKGSRFTLRIPAEG